MDIDGEELDAVTDGQSTAQQQSITETLTHNKHNTQNACLVSHILCCIAKWLK